MSLSEVGLAREALKVKDYQASIDLATEAIKKDPTNYDAWACRGTALIFARNYYAAILNSDKALELKPDIFEALNNRGAAYSILNLLNEAVADFNKALEINPEAWEPHTQLGLMYASINQLDAAEYHFRESAKKCNGVAFPHSALGTLLLGRGQWKEGFEEDNNRLEITDQPFPAPHWQGEDLAGKHIMLWTEQGQGDRLLSLRYIDTVYDNCPDAKITVKVQEGMYQLVKQSFPTVDVVLNTVPCDYVCSLLNVPMVLEMTWDTVPRPQRYLTADIAKTMYWQQKLKALGDGIKIGLCTASLNGLHGVGKSLNPAVIEEFGTLPQAHFISLQVPRVDSKARIKLHDWADEIQTWADTAALIEALDVVVSVDTAVCHLAGALGKSVCTLVKHSTFWPWMEETIPPSGQYSIWYPSMTLFRQQITGEWSMPMRRLILALQRGMLGLH